jgi:hypothetical protein
MKGRREAAAKWADFTGRKKLAALIQKLSIGVPCSPYNNVQPSSKKMMVKRTFIGGLSSKICRTRMAL